MENRKNRHFISVHDTLFKSVVKWANHYKSISWINIAKNFLTNMRQSTVGHMTIS